MSIDSDVYSVMTSYAPLTALVPNKIFPHSIAQGVVMPAVGYSVSSNTVVDLSGVVQATQSRVVVQSWAETITQAKEIADAIVAAFAVVFVPMDSRDGEFDIELGLHAETVEFDWWS